MIEQVVLKNRSMWTATYLIPDSTAARVFAPQEEKKVPKEEVQKLLFQDGARNLLKDCFIIYDEELANDLYDGNIEPEYWYKDEDIKAIMLNNDIDKFLDMLDFAPSGVLDIVKGYAITLPLTDINKINALKDKTGFDTLKVLAQQNTYQDEAPEEEVEQKPVRRVKKKEESAPTQKVVRRTASK